MKKRNPWDWEKDSPYFGGRKPPLPTSSFRRIFLFSTNPPIFLQNLVLFPLDSAFDSAKMLYIQLFPGEVDLCEKPLRSEPSARRSGPAGFGGDEGGRRHRRPAASLVDLRLHLLPSPRNRHRRLRHLRLQLSPSRTEVRRGADERDRRSRRRGGG